MDVRCEKCQTEYELDESRLKPGGVTVKCTNCGHMFKIRKRTPTNVGLPAVTAPDEAQTTRREPSPSSPQRLQTPPAGTSRADSVLGDGTPGSINDGGSGPTERQWLVRLENGDQKTCRELATLQQWIVAGVATRESLISRSGKTWKRLGDIAELSQYFSIADEARTQRAQKPTPKPVAATMLGVGKPTAAGGTILPEDGDEMRTTGSFRARRSTPPPPPPRGGSGPNPLPKSPNSSELALQQTEMSRPRVPTPPPVPVVGAGRATGTWASSELKHSDSMAAMPQGPRGGRISMQENEPAFAAGRVRITPGDESSFQTGKVSRLAIDDDDDDMIAPPRGSRAGTWIALLALVVIAAGAGAVYLLVFNKKGGQQAAVKQDAAAVALVADAGGGAIVSPIVDAGPPVAADPLDAARTELLAGIEPRMKGVYDALAPKDDPASLAMRARLATGMAQSMVERANLAADKAEADKLRKESKQLVIEAATLAQKAFKAAADDPSANLAMSDVLRLQGKSLKDVQRYLEAAKAKGAADKELARSIAVADAQALERDAKLDDALKELGALDAAGDTRVQQELAMIAYAQGKPNDAKPFVDQILASAPDHEVARALQKRLETAVAKTDPMPNEGSGSVHHDPVTPPNNGGGGGGGGGDYDSLLAKADKLAVSTCSSAMPLYGKALEQKPTGVEALTGMGYCYLNGKQFASAFSKFRSALAVSQRFEPALAGVAETYQQQGNREQAIEAWQHYLDAYPGSAKATKQLQILGAGATTTNTGSGEAPPAPTPAPAPAPTTPPAGDGSAS